MLFERIKNDLRVFLAVTRLTVYRQLSVQYGVVAEREKLKKLVKNHVCVRFRPGGQLADKAPVLKAGGKPSTWLPPERLVEQKTGQLILSTFDFG